MAPVPAYTEPLLSLSCHTDDDDDDGRSSGGRSVARSASSRRRNSCGNLLDAGGGNVRRGVDGGSGRGGGSVGRAGGNARFKRCQTAPGYVSFEDVIGPEVPFRREGRGALRQPEEAGIISDPLVWTASRLYAREMTAAHQPRHRRPSPGPLGTRRGGAMHWLVKKYVNPCLGFLASAFFCCSAASATCPVAS